MKLTLPIIPDTDYDRDYYIYMNHKELTFWQSVGILPANIKEGDMVCGGKLVITRPITIENEA